MTSNPGPNNPTLTQSYFTQSRNSWGRFSSLLCHRVPCGSEREVSTPRGLSLANLSSSWLFIGQVKHFPCHCFSLDRSCKMPHLKEPRTNKCQKRCLGEREKLCTNTSQCTVEEQLALFGYISSPGWCILVDIPPPPIRHSGLVNTWISSIVLRVIIRLGRVKIYPPILLLHKISSIKSILFLRGNKPGD